MRNFLSRLFGERSGEPIGPPSARVRVADAKAKATLGDLYEGAPDAQPPDREPAPVEADQGAWQREREQRERDGRA